ncbi:Susd and RagB outer membrane lipoprotein [Tannerella forsythia]|uniref:SusD/RagB family nutrient-binding outer membrane lipoprotein n=1 Tax=Tannerella forsythia TaxID=28112 RepID=UPI000869844E|nr:SusD/RagB family nutrient-binding outer membrane lipoprotein [Tannerella forsythia]SCQ22338.1 Susd and RagB outer membrane lipoprotein [Tannerella forsythia]
MLTACGDFDEINKNPTAADIDQVQIEYFINSSIIGAQQNPHVAERAFVLYWKDAGHMDRIGTLSTGYTDNGWTTDYFNEASKWLGDVNTAIQVGEMKIQSGNIDEYSNNLLQVARIWRVYMMSELTDLFGPIPMNGFQGVNPDFNKVEEIYDFMLKELKDAVAKMNDKTVIDRVKKTDPAYEYDFNKWKKYGNSMRMRLAMRISNVDPARAKAEFEDAAKGSNFIASLSDNFKVQEKSGWDPLTGVMSREWNAQRLSTTINNLYIGLGGVSTESQVKGDAKALAMVKPENWMGIKYEQQFTTKTNDPSAGYWFDGLHAKIDPRAYKTFIIPGQFDNPEYNKYPSWVPDQTSKTERPLLKPRANDPEKTDTLVKIDAAYCWNAAVGGSWDKKGSYNKVIGWPGCLPRLANRFRNSSESRIFFASWESYFLIAEAAVKGWTVPMSGKAAYEKGIEESFKYWNVSEHYEAYIASENYNRVGTSVKWEHVAEPSATVSMQYKDGETDETKTMDYKYPINTIYKKGSVRNDLLTKIITQKFLAQVPWLPLEAWNDHRRLGLPFFENPARELPLEGMPALTESNYMTNSWDFFPQRVPYPAFLKNNVPEGYNQAVSLLGGKDDVHTVLWWAKH